MKEIHSATFGDGIKITGFPTMDNSDKGFDELKSIDDVENMVSNKGTTLVVVNSVCE